MYKESLPENILVSKTIIDLFSILQQAEDKGIDIDKINILKSKVLELAKKRYKLKDVFGLLYFGDICLGKTSESILFNERKLDLDKDISVSDAYNLTLGSVPYVKAKDAVDFAVNTSVSKLKTYELCNILKMISNGLDDTIEKISDISYAIDSRIINRRNNSGLKLCESVNLDMNKTKRKVYSLDELDRMLSHIKILSRDNLLTLISTNGLSIEKELCNKILDKSSKVGINRYYAETIIDQIDFDSIFNDERELTDSEREILINRLEKVNCFKIYDVLEKLGIDKDKISQCIFNLMVEDGYKGYSFKELCDLDNLEEIISLNINNLNTRISVLKIDEALGIVDNQNYVNDSSINLRDYQQDALDNIEATFKDKRFSGVILPTGAGKSFVAMSLMLKYKDKNIIYYAPNSGILAQIKKHIVRNIIGLNVITDRKKQRLLNEGKTIPKDVITLSEADEVIKSVFPHLKFYCYQGLTTKDEDVFKMYDADLLVFDELHRTGAAEWNQKITKLVKNNSNAKILGITATPIRDDATHKDMMLEFAKLSGDYSSKELTEKRYLSSELYLTDAMQDGIVVIPNLVAFDYNLAESDEFREVQAMLKKVKEEKEKEKLKKIYKEMVSIIRNSKKEGVNAIINNAFKNNNKRKNGKYIIFLPMNNTGVSTEEYIKEQMEEVKEYFSDIDSNPEMSFLFSNRTDGIDNDAVIEDFEEESDHLKLIFSLNMLNEGIHVEGIDGLVMLRPISSNAKTLYNQQIGRTIHALLPDVDIESEDAPLIFDVYNNYIAHNMDREVNMTNTTSDLQKIRAISKWIFKHGGYFPDINSEDLSEYRRALTLKKIQLKYKRYLDNIFNQNMTSTEKYEIEEIISIGMSIDLWNREFSDRVVDRTIDIEDDRVNVFKAVGEQKRFIDLYKEAKEVTNSRTNVSVGTLRIKDIISTLELLSEYGVEINNENVDLYTNLMDVLSELEVDVYKAIKEELQVPLAYNLGEEYNYAKEMFYSKKHKCFNNYPIRLLRNCGIFEPYIDKKGNEIEFVDNRGFIIKGPADFISYNIYTGTKYDINGYDIDGYDENYFKINEQYNIYGFDREGIHVKTKSFLNPYGFDINGDYYELDGDNYVNLGKYNRYGFDINHRWFKKTINKMTGEIKYSYTGKKYDDEGFDFYGFNKYSFDREGFYYIVDENYKKEIGDEEDYIKRIKTNNKVNERGFNKDGIHLNGTKYGDDEFDIDGIHLNGNMYNEYGFNYKHLTRTGKKYNKYGFNFEGINRDTKEVYDRNYFDRDGYFYNFYGEKTYNKYNDRFFDRDGFYYEKDENGVLHKTDRKHDNYGFNASGYNKDTHHRVDKNGFDRDGYYVGIDYLESNSLDNRVSKVNEYGFDRDGYYYKKKKNNVLYNTNNKYNEDGFQFDRIHIETGELWDKFGLDIDRKKDSYIEHKGFGKDGIYWREQEDGTYAKDGKLDDDSRDSEGHKYVVDPDDETKLVGIETLFTKDGISKITGVYWDEHGLDSTGRYAAYENRHGFDSNGDFWDFDEDGNCYNTHRKYNNNYFDRSGFYYELDSNGKYIKTDKKVDERGFRLDGYYAKTEKKYDLLGFDINKVFLPTNSRYDFRGYDADGYHKDTGKQFNEYGFDREGLLWILKEDGSYEKVNSQYNLDGIDAHGFNENGIYVKTNLPYDENFFDAKGVHIFTNDIYDENEFDRDGYTIGYYGNKAIDYRGFAKNGYNVETKSIYDKEGKDIFGHSFYKRVRDEAYKPFQVRIASTFQRKPYLAESLISDVATRYGITSLDQAIEKFAEVVYIGLKLEPELKETNKEKAELKSDDIHCELEAYKYDLKKLEEDETTGISKLVKVEKKIKIYEKSLKLYNILNGCDE